jgi:hypothetical protein
MNFGVSTPLPGGGASSRGWVRTVIQTLLILTAVMLPVVVMAYSSNPPAALTGAPGEGTCGSCHSPVTAGSGVTVAFPGNTLTYAPGGAAVPLSVALTGTGGFELSTRVQNDNSQAGTLAAGANSALTTSSSVQYVRQTARAASFSVTWTPPATDVGNVVVYVAGVIGGQTYTNSYTLTPAVTAPPETISVSNSTLAFTYGGTAAAAQTVQVTSSGASLPFTATVATSSGGNWLSATPAAGNTPQGVSVSADANGLAVGTYSGTVTIASTGASNSPQTIDVTFDVTVAGPQPSPSISASPASLSFSAATNTTAVTPQSIDVSSSGTAVNLTAAATTATGGNWLSVTPASGPTPLTLAVAVDPTGLADGTYTGAVTVTGASASNSPLSIPVTLTVGTVTPPAAGPLSFSFNVIDSLSGGTDSLLLSGRGFIDSSAKIKGGGYWYRYAAGSGSSGDREGHHRGHRSVSSGTWAATGVKSFTPATSGKGGVLEITIDVTPLGGKPQKGTLRIASTGSDKGVKLTLDSGSVFMPTGTGFVVITTGTSSGGGEDDPGSGGPRRGHDH